MKDHKISIEMVSNTQTKTSLNFIKFFLTLDLQRISLLFISLIRGSRPTRPCVLYDLIVKIHTNLYDNNSSQNGHGNFNFLSR